MEKAMPKNGPEPTDLHVGKRVRMRRMMLGLSQTQLGDALGITFQQVQKYERGTNRISASRLQRTADVLQVPVPFFFEGLPDGAGAPGVTPPPPYLFEFLTSLDGVSLTKAFMRIPNASLRRSIVNLVVSIADPELQ
jgi:transcriptional regulator with XRE-family HTH domain